MPDEIRAPESDRQLAELAIDNADTPDVNWRGLALDLAERLLGSAGLAPISTLTGEPCGHSASQRCIECASDEELAASIPSRPSDA